MASAQASFSKTCPLEEHITCSICMEVFVDPVTTACGHSFCKECLDCNCMYLDGRCPLCKEHVTKIPQVNIVLRNIVEEMKKTLEEEYTMAPGEVACDICTEQKLKAEKSCLVCLASYCSTHLENHTSTERLKGHKLVEPVENLDERACLQHGRPLELYSRRTKRYICVRCMEEDQEEVVSTEDEWNKKKEKRLDREPPTPAYPETVVRPKKKDRRDQTLSQVAHSEARTGYWSTNSYTDHPTAATIKEEPESPIPRRSSKRATKSKADHQLQDFPTLPQMYTSVRENPTPTYPVPVEERNTKKKDRKEQIFSEENWSINSRNDSATTAAIKEEHKSPLAISQQSSQAAKNSTSGHLPHDFSTGVQVTKMRKERPPIPPKVKIKELPTPTHPATVVRHEERLREDQTLSQNAPVFPSNSATATTIKEKPKSPFQTPQQSVQRVTNSKAGQQVQESCTGLQGNGSGRGVSRTPPLATVVQPKEKNRKNQTPSQARQEGYQSELQKKIKEREEKINRIRPAENVPDSTNSSAAEATTKRDAKSMRETAQPDSSTVLKAKELAQMFGGTTTQEAAVRPKKKRREERNLSKVKLLAQELAEATTVRVTAVQPKQKENEDPKLPQVQVTKMRKERPPVPPKVKIKELPTPTHPATVVQHEERLREDQTLSQNVPDSTRSTIQMNSASAETTTEENPHIDFSAGMKVKDLARMFSATQETAVPPKGKHRG